MKKLFFLLLALALLGGCAKKYPTYEDAERSRFIKVNYLATDRLLATLSETLDPRIPLIVATLVGIDELTESSRLGRAVSEQIGARLVMRGFPVVELKVRGNIFVKRSEGELLLSREVQDLARKHEAQALVVGTYSVARHYIYLNLKMISAHNNVIIAAHDYVLPITPDIHALLTTAPVPDRPKG